MRKVQRGPPARVQALRPALLGMSHSVWSQAIPIEVVTPLFGGGHTAGQIDEVTPISAKSIRGHLRFWWRWMIGRPQAEAAHRSGRDGILEMSLREAEIFGSTDLPSPFDLIVSDAQPASSKHRTSPDYGFQKANHETTAPELYALFSAKNNKVPRLWREGLKFTLSVRWSSARIHDQDEIAAHLRCAMWAWLTFGGIGSRTRRGLGAIRSEHAEFQSPPKMSHIEHSRFPDVVSRPANDAMTGWHDAIQLLRDFRQTNVREPGAGRTKQTVAMTNDKQAVFLRPLNDVAGRTRLPEADSVRVMTGQHLKPKKHRLQNSGPADLAVTFHDHSPNLTEPLFPRAMFGLPLITHFSDGPSRATNLAGLHESDLDPGQSDLLPVIVDSHDGKLKVGERMGSPLIVRPFWVNGAWHSGLIFIRSPESDRLDAHLKSKQLIPKYQAAPNVPNARIAGAAIKAHSTTRGHDDILHVFQTRAVIAGYRPVNWGPR